MKQFKIKRMKILGNPTNVADVSTMNTDDYEDDWLLEAEKMEMRRLRAWRQHLGNSA